MQHVSGISLYTVNGKVLAPSGVLVTFGISSNNGKELHYFNNGKELHYFIHIHGEERLCNRLGPVDTTREVPSECTKVSKQYAFMAFPGCPKLIIT